eukprot:CAMPEP_0176003150 /NCGR_PEP_ID=MMETSP0120_2-20121206/1021_1 /TAXON_ID=160619 /ORGANISM="Kryptoperidinium foliaceum, Strain CCMP 1326" /LENGTH=361 /DNA_ID=CAMNT_0017335775 /DNA_START=179 /DNA_END=1264 /DNA_ORIENTATION=-
MADDDHSDDDDTGKGRGKSRRELPAGAVATLKAWLLSPEHFTHPYPTPQDQAMLMQKTGIDKKQLKNWFTNARRRIWKPMLKKQLEQGKLAPTGPGGGVVMPGAVPGLMVPSVGPPMEAQAQYQPPPHAGQPDVQQQMVDQYGNPLYGAPSAPPPVTQNPQYYDSNTPAPAPMPMTSSIGSLGALARSGSSTHMMSKTDSHAVLMELFARDQDLVRQATESAGLKRPQDGSQSASGQNYSESSASWQGQFHIHKHVISDAAFPSLCIMETPMGMDCICLLCVPAINGASFGAKKWNPSHGKLLRRRVLEDTITDNPQKTRPMSDTCYFMRESKLLHDVMWKLPVAAHVTCCNRQRYTQIYF